MGFFSFFIPSVEGYTQFEEVTEKAGLEYFGRTYGSSWGDLNSDGWPDLLTTNHGWFGNGTFLYLNNGDGTFSNVKNKMIAKTVLDADLHGAAWGDMDNDGDQDIIILTGAGRGSSTSSNLFLKNNGDVFQEKASDYDLEFSMGRGRMPIWLDENNDGLLDVLFVNWPRSGNRTSTVLLQQSDNSFKNIYDLDWFEKLETATYSNLYNDGNSYILFLNSIPPGASYPENLIVQKIAEKIYSVNIKNAKDIVVADFNLDLLLDIFVVTGSDAKNPFHEDWLMMQTEYQVFNRQTVSTSLNKSTSCRSIVAGDFDNDMDIDVYLVCSIWGVKKSEVNPRDKNLENILYENLGNGTFKVAPNNWGAKTSTFGAGETASLVDYDNDGFLDIFVSNGGGWSEVAKGGYNQLFRNMGNDNNWIEIDLIGTISNRDAIGSRVFVTADGITQIREQNGGIHYHAQNHQRLHFGVGNNTIIDNIEVYWPSGEINRYENIETNQILKIIEKPSYKSPREQVEQGTAPREVTCRDNFVLIFKATNSKPACVTESTKFRLEDRGWALNTIN